MTNLSSLLEKDYLTLGGGCGLWFCWKKKFAKF